MKNFILQLTSSPNLYYEAGVVEFVTANSEDDPDDQLRDNLEKHIEIIESNEAKNLDILVFPEYSLNSVATAVFVPRVADHIVACNNTKFSSVVQRISCAAQRNRKYIVINLTTKDNCTGKPQNNDTKMCISCGFNLYNTAVVFDRDGAVIST